MKRVPEVMKAASGVMMRDRASMQDAGFQAADIQQTALVIFMKAALSHAAV